MSKKIENYESIREKLLKLQALVERGYRGEADNARRILDKLCAKYGVSLDEILNSEPPISPYSFVVGRDKQLKEIFFQCYYKVMKCDKIRYSMPTRDSISTKMTAFQFAELKGLFEWHKSNFQRELEELKDTVMNAYILKHKLFSDCPSGNMEIELMTRERLEKLRKIVLMAETLNDNHYQKMIEQK